MKKIFLFCIALTLTGLFSVVHAQKKAELTDRELSAKYKQEIDILTSEIKTIKLKLKADSDNKVQLQSDLEDKTNELKEVKNKKNIIDNAIKSKAASEKAAKNAEKAAINAEKAKQKAEKSESDAKQLKEKE